MADINPNISGSTVDPKWIDGGPENPEPTFDIDKPSFWLPMTVLSGLASGFCERAAVISGGSVGGQAWEGTSASVKEGIVSCLAANLAKGVNPNTSMTNMFSSANTEMLPPRTSSTSHYMKSFDAMLTKLATGGYMRVVTGSEPTAYAFNTLSTDALARAQNKGSAATSVGSSGGTYTSRFMNAFTIEYPIHRKWMLDELKYTATGADTTYLNAVGDLTGYLLGTNEVIESAGTINSAVSSYIYNSSAGLSSETVGGVALNRQAYTLLEFTRIVSGGTSYTISAASPIAYGMLATWSSAATIESPIDVYFGAARATDTDEDLWFISNTYNNTTSSWYNVPFYHSGTSTITVTQPYVTPSSYIVGSEAKITFTAQATSDGWNDGTEISCLDIKSGGTVYIDPGVPDAYRITSVGACNIGSGATLNSGSSTFPRTSGSAYSNVLLGIGLYNNYRPIMTFYDGLDQASYIYESGGTLTQLPMHGGGRYYGLYVFGADNGPVQTEISLISSSNDHIMNGALIESGCTVTVTSPKTRIEGDVGVMPAAVLSQTDGYIATVRVASGATATIGSECFMVYVQSGGSLYLNDNCRLSFLYIDDGAKVYITGASISDGVITNTDGNDMLGNVTVNLYHQLQISGISSGWNTSITATNRGTGNAQFAGTSYATPISGVRAAISSAVLATNATNPIHDITDAVYSGFGSSTVGGVTYSGYAVFGQLGSCTVTYGAQALAIYPTDSGGMHVQDHYSSFRCRQFYKDPDEA
jgi:hypothetical protein